MSRVAMTHYQLPSKCVGMPELVKNLLPGALEALHKRRLKAGEPGCSTLGVEAAAKLAQDREKLAAALDAATGAYANDALRELLLAGDRWRATCAGWLDTLSSIYAARHATASTQKVGGALRHVQRRTPVPTRA
jgi:hypothetical protein